MELDCDRLMVVVVVVELDTGQATWQDADLIFLLYQKIGIAIGRVRKYYKLLGQTFTINSNNNNIFMKSFITTDLP